MVSMKAMGGMERRVRVFAAGRLASGIAAAMALSLGLVSCSTGDESPSHTGEVQTPPPTEESPDILGASIDEGPASSVSDPRASFVLSCIGEGCRLECRLQDGAWSPCASPHTLEGLERGKHRLAVRARDASGEKNSPPETWTWTVVAEEQETDPSPVQSTWPLPHTGQRQCYDHAQVIPCPAPGEPFYGQNAQQQGPAMRYSIHDDGSVMDEVTGLMWQQKDDGVSRSWSDSLAYCEGLILAEHEDWRLPTEWELQSILNYGAASPAIDGQAFPDTKWSYYWTSTTHSGNPESAWVVLFSYGYVLQHDKADDSPFSRCVR